MNKLVRFFLMSTMAFTVFACGKDEPAPVIPELKIGSADLSQDFTGDGGTKSITVTANGQFTATADQDWVTISNLTYSPTAQSFFTINVAKSTVEEPPTAAVTVALTGAASVTIDISQEEGVADRDFLKPTGLWTVAKPGDIEWFTWTKDVDANGSEGVKAAGPPPTIAGPRDVQAWALKTEDHIKFYSPLTAPAKNYTIMWDLRVNEKPGPGYIPLFQPYLNDGDAAAFYNTNGSKYNGRDHIAVGFVASYSDSIVEYSKWHRLVAVVNIANGVAQMYLNGKPITQPNGELRTKTDMATEDNNQRFTIGAILYLFLDNDGEDGPIDCAGFAVWDQPLTAEEVAALGNTEKRIY
jgi:hypothetical protein